MRRHMRWARRVLAGVLSAALLPLCAAAQGKPAEAAAPSEGGMSAFGRDGYDAYIGRYADAPRPVTVVPVPAAACEGTPAPEVLPVFEGRTDVVVFDQAETTLTWKVTVGTAGLYRVAVDYYPAPGRTGNAGEPDRHGGRAGHGCVDAVIGLNTTLRGILMHFNVLKRWGRLLLNSNIFHAGVTSHG